MELTYVHKFLAEAGMGSRRDMVEAMKAGKVKVNDKTTQDPRFQIDPSHDKVSLNNQPVKARAAKVYVMLHKPVGYITTTDDEQDRPTVMDLLPPQLAEIRLFPIGRLDQDTEGLLVLTNDGELSYQLTHPKFEHEKEYEVTIAAELTDKQIREVKRGMLLEDGRTSPAKIKQAFISQHVTYYLTIHEGRKRQIRRMFERLGFRVLKLKRIRVGGLQLDPKLVAGHARVLTSTELELLQQSTRHKRSRFVPATTIKPGTKRTMAAKPGKLTKAVPARMAKRPVKNGRVKARPGRTPLKQT